MTQVASRRGVKDVNEDIFSGVTLEPCLLREMTENDRHSVLDWFYDVVSRARDDGECLYLISVRVFKFFPKSGK